ncbi:hypothetical protein EHQ72_13350 [Leptospira yasudae]|nr:hypothetical protein EHQ72_13350 [Leptospira yasudae]
MPPPYRSAPLSETPGFKSEALKIDNAPVIVKNNRIQRAAVPLFFKNSFICIEFVSRRRLLRSIADFL